MKFYKIITVCLLALVCQGCLLLALAGLTGYAVHEHDLAHQPKPSAVSTPAAPKP